MSRSHDLEMFTPGLILSQNILVIPEVKKSFIKSMLLSNPFPETGMAYNPNEIETTRAHNALAMTIFGCSYLVVVNSVSLSLETDVHVNKNNDENIKKNNDVNVKKNKNGFQSQS